MLCRKLNLPGDTLGIDGSKFKALNNHDRSFTRAKMNLVIRLIGCKQLLEAM